MIPDIGVSNGIMSTVLNYAKAMPDDIVFDVVYFAEKEKTRQSDIEALGGRVFKISAPSPSSAVKGEMKKFFAEHKGEWDVLHINAPHFALFIASFAKAAGIKKICVHSHSTEFSLKGNSSRNMLLSLYAKAFVKDKFACSEESGKFWYGNLDFTVLRNAVDCKEYEYNSNVRQSKRIELGLTDELVIGHIGRTDIPQKNHGFILQVFSEICKLNDNSKLLLVGAEQTDELSKQCNILNIQDRVEFLGSRGDVSELLNAFDVFLFPSTSEGLPVSVIEAQASGLPVVMSDVITDEVIVCDTVKKVSLSDSPTIWAETCIEAANNKRTSSFNEMCDAGWDINSCSQILVDYYKGLIQ